VKGVPIENKVNDHPIYLTVVSDITDESEKELRLNELKKINMQLEIQQQRYEILEATAQGLLFEYMPQEDTMVLSYNFPNNKKRKVLTNYSHSIQKSPLVHSSHIEMFRHALSEACQHEMEGNLEYLSAVSGGGYRWHLTHYKSLANEDGTVLSVLGRIEDIHDQKMEKEKLNYKADMDGLTNLYRKEAAFEKMNEYVREGRNAEFYFVILDLDDFKQINDQYGHQYGDKILRQTSDELQHLFGETSILGRFGGDEFIILTKDISSGEVRKLLENLQEDVKFCAGITPWKMGEDIMDIFNKADKAMYHVKNDNKNGIFVLE
jgi:diguanylate cyclase (GGDEF)-like protein